MLTFPRPPSSHRQLNSLDAQFLAMEDGRVHGHVMTVGVYDPSTAPDGRLTRQRVVDLVAARLHTLAPLRQKLVEVPFSVARPYWADDPDFDLDRHVLEHRLPTPGDESQLAELIADLTRVPLDRARPLWEMHVVQGLIGGRVAVLFKVSHAVVDGVSGTGLITSLLDESPLTGTPPPVKTPVEQAPGAAAMLLRGLEALVRHPVQVLDRLPRALPHLDLVPTLGALPGVAQTARLVRRVHRGDIHRSGTGPIGAVPRTRFNRRVSGRRHYAFASLPLVEVKTISSRFGVTVNDVLLAITAGGLRAWLDERGELPDIPLVGLVPISVRVEEGEGFGNRIGMLQATLPTHEPDSRRRLQAVHESTLQAKKRHSAGPPTLLQDVNDLIPHALFGPALRAISTLVTQPGLTAGANLMVSNIPGPSRPLYLAGARLEGHFPVGAILHGIGLTITVMRYLDHLHWGVTFDRFADVNAWSMMRAIQAAQKELHDLARNA